jgi:hypothetical protein
MQNRTRTTVRVRVVTAAGTMRRWASPEPLNSDLPRARDGRKFLATFFQVIALLGLAWGTVECVVDPYGILPLRIFPQVTPDDRGRKMALFRKFARRGEVAGIVLGSSRCMKIQPRDQGRWFNFAVGSATPEDYLAIYRWVRAQGVAPQKILLGVDVLTLNDAYPTSGDLLDTQALRFALEGRQPTLADRVQDLAQDFGRGFTTAFVRDALAGIRQRFWPRPLEMVLQPDGFAIFPVREQQHAAKGYDFAAVRAADIPRYTSNVGVLGSASRRRRGILEEFLREARAGGAEVTLWQTEFEPGTEQALLAETAYARLNGPMRSYIRSLAPAFGIRVVDIRDVIASPGMAGAWYDCVHYDDRLGTALTERVLRVN